MTLVRMDTADGTSTSYWPLVLPLHSSHPEQPNATFSFLYFLSISSSYGMHYRVNTKPASPQYQFYTEYIISKEWDTGPSSYSSVRGPLN